MTEVTKNFEKALQKINLNYGLFRPVLIGVIFGRILAFNNPNFFRENSQANLVYYTVFSLGVLVFIIHSKTVGKLSRFFLAAVYIFYHISLGLLVIYLDPYPTPFMFQFIALAIATDMVFGRLWQRLSFIYFTIVLYLSYMAHDQPHTTEGYILIILYAFGAAAVGYLVSKYRQISDEERAALDKSTEESSFERQRLLSLINNMGEAVVATDETGKIMIYNAAALNLLDTNQNLEGKNLDTLLKLRDHTHKLVKLTSLLSKSPTGLTNTDLIHEFSPGDVINMYINIAPVKLGFKDESESGYIIIMRDITKEKSLEDERDEFISVVSHELRTPIAIAEGNLSNAIFSVQAKPDIKLIESALQESHDQVLFLSNMINDLATLSRAERSDVKLEISDINPAELLHEIARDYKIEADTKKLKLSVTAAKNTKIIRSSDLYLREILQNFITNSLKYTKAGSIVVHVRSDIKGNAIFSVADTGIGLSKSDQKRIFEKFFRSEDYRTRESSGTGLGLYVTAKLAHRIKATIDVESQLNKGSTFTITIPSLEK